MVNTNTNNITYWGKIKKLKKNKHLTFIHTPKCGGKFVGSILKELNIKNKGHKRADPKKDGITFTVIRNPIERLESFLNYRLGEKKPRKDWPKSLNYVWNDKSVSLNNVLGKMSDKEIIGFKPYNSLCHWSENIDIFITIDKLEKFLLFFGYKVNIKEFEKRNVSKKVRGSLNKQSKDRISKLYSRDMVLFKTKILQ
mgnify:CR=1 FL=1|tara:strand:- start:523 stop:1113 length:591 start_codon:yes stop_codon:yes gene_type:complete